MAQDKTLTHLQGLDPRIRDKALALVYYARSYGRMPLVVVSGRRSYAEQVWLYGQGRWRPGPIITNTLDSKHRQGLAFDVGFRGGEPPAWHWDWVGVLGEYLGLRWGGRWTKLVDKPHFYL